MFGTCSIIMIMTLLLSPLYLSNFSLIVLSPFHFNISEMNIHYLTFSNGALIDFFFKLLKELISFTLTHHRRIKKSRDSAYNANFLR